MTEVNDLKKYAVFFTDCGGVAGVSPAEGGSVRLAAYGVKSLRSFALQNSTHNAARLERGGRLPPFYALEIC
jgi:hypothetical protein